MELFHDCDSSAEARGFKVVVHLPSYADYYETDWVHNIGRDAYFENNRPHSIEFWFHSIEKTEFLR